MRPGALPGIIEQWQRMWTYLRRKPHVQMPMAESRITFRRNETRPLTERLGKAGAERLSGAKASRLGFTAHEQLPVPQAGGSGHTHAVAGWSRTTSGTRLSAKAAPSA